MYECGKVKKVLGNKIAIKIYLSFNNRSHFFSYFFKIHSEGHRFCKNKRHNVSGLLDLFHLAPDGLLHFTDLHNDIRHLDKKGSPEFCIEALHHEVT